MSNKLRERVADLVRYNADPLAIAEEAIALIRGETLEEAAKVAESIKTIEIDGYAYQVDGPTQDATAAAIRAMKGKP